MEVGFQLERIYRDSDVVEIRVSAWNGTFGGVSDVYVGVGRLGEVAAGLHGFPSTVTDNREFTLGAFGSEFAGGGVSMRFYCRDASAHVMVESRIESSWAAGLPQSVVLLLPTEPAAIDLFVEELRAVESNQIAVARLRGTVFAGDNSGDKRGRQMRGPERVNE
jgi:hypothetical protein